VRRPGRLRAGPLALAGSLLATVGALGACAGPHLGLSNGSVSACFRALPTATAAIHDGSAHLVGVHRVPADRVRAHLPGDRRSELGDNDTTVCAVVFKGDFRAGQVSLARPTASGHYAIVLVDSHNLHLVAAVVLDRLPAGLGRRLV
jgi:hypothetical protein